MLKIIKQKNKAGFTLIELLIYVSVVVIIGTMVAMLIPQLVRNNSYIQARGEVLNNVKRAIDEMSYEIKNSASIYTPTSVFDSHPGQLSLQTTLNNISNEDYTFVDFYIDDNRLYKKREESPAQLIVSEKIKIDSLVFTNLNTSSLYAAIQINITASYDTNSATLKEQSKVTISSIVSLRSY